MKACPRNLLQIAGYQPGRGRTEIEGDIEHVSWSRWSYWIPILVGQAIIG